MGYGRDVFLEKWCGEWWNWDLLKCCFPKLAGAVWPTLNNCSETNILLQTTIAFTPVSRMYLQALSLEGQHCNQELFLIYAPVVNIYWNWIFHSAPNLKLCSGTFLLPYTGSDILEIVTSALQWQQSRCAVDAEKFSILFLHLNLHFFLCLSQIHHWQNSFSFEIVGLVTKQQYSQIQQMFRSVNS